VGKDAPLTKGKISCLCNEEMKSIYFQNAFKPIIDLTAQNVTEVQKKSPKINV